MFSKIIILVLGLLTLVSAQRCSSFVVNSGGRDLSFNNYIYQDFRQLAASSPKAKRAIANSQAYFTSQRTLWQKQTYERKQGRYNPIGMLNLEENVFIDYDASTNNRNTMLSLVTSRLQNGTQVAGELASTFDLLYGSIRFQARVTGDKGGCAGMFFYKSDTLESDFEFLTDEGGRNLHMTNQPGLEDGEPVPGAHTNLTLSRSFTEWNTYRLDWYPGMTRYFVNGVAVVNKTTNVSPQSMKWIMNMWSNGEPSWSGVMKPGNSARLDVRYLQIAYNNPALPAPAAGGYSCRLQNEMDGQGLIITVPKGSRGKSLEDSDFQANHSQAGGSVVARAAQLVGAAVAGRVVGEAMR